MGNAHARAVPVLLKSSIAFRGEREKEGRQDKWVESNAVLVLPICKRVARKLAPCIRVELTSTRKRGLAKILC